MSRSGGDDGVKTGACTSGHYELWLQPAELTEHWCDVYTCTCTGYRTGCTVLVPLRVSRLRSEGCKPCDIRQKLSGHKPTTEVVIRTKSPSVIAFGSVIVEA